MSVVGEVSNTESFVLNWRWIYRPAAVTVKNYHFFVSEQPLNRVLIFLIVTVIAMIRSSILMLLFQYICLQRLTLHDTQSSLCAKLWSIFVDFLESAAPRFLIIGLRPVFIPKKFSMSCQCYVSVLQKCDHNYHEVIQAPCTSNLYQVGDRVFYKRLTNAGLCPDTVPNETWTQRFYYSENVILE